MALHLARRFALRCVDYYDLGCRDPDDSDIFDGGAVPRIDPQTVDLDRARRGHQVAITSFTKRVFYGSPESKQLRAG